MENKQSKSADIKEIRERKKALRREMGEIQSDIESSLNIVKGNFSDRISPRYWVNRYPLQMAGTALFIGFVIARKIGRGKGIGILSGGMFRGILGHELKKMATQRAVRYLVNRIEDAIDERTKKEL